MLVTTINQSINQFYYLSDYNAAKLLEYKRMQIMTSRVLKAQVIAKYTEGGP